VDREVSLKVFVKYVIPFLVSKAFVNCCSFDIVWKVVVGASFDEF